MSVRVVARIRPLLEKELDKDIIVRPDSSAAGNPHTIVKIPNPRNEAEDFSFAFNGVYDQTVSQEALFTSEVAPHLKSLFQGYDVTIFAYGVTGTGKTHTMRGGLKLADRGVIPRMLSGVFRRGKKITKDSGGQTTVKVSLSYYEIYNDKVFDLLEPPEKRTASGLPLRAEANGKTVVAGLSERACEDLRDFEKLYIEANNNRVTASTKLNAHSSRSHAILRVKLTQITGDSVRESTASAIDLAGSEDNRRTDNGKERLVESAAINKSLFVLSQCIDAISRGDKRIPYRESKMTRILSLGQNHGITVMILNLAPLRSYHLDTLSSLNISSRAKRIEVREIENEVVYKQMPKSSSGLLGSNSNSSGGNAPRQPLRPLANAFNSHNVHSGNVAAVNSNNKAAAEQTKPVKAFSVYTDQVVKSNVATRPIANSSQIRRSNSNKRPSEKTEPVTARPNKIARPVPQQSSVTVSPADLEALVEKKVSEILAARTAAEQMSPPSPPQVQAQVDAINDTVQRRLEALERRIDSEEYRDDAKSEGLRHLLAARHHKEKGDDLAALHAYEMALPYFPGQVKLLGKIDKLRARLNSPQEEEGVEEAKKEKKSAKQSSPAKRRAKKRARVVAAAGDADEDGEADVDDESYLDDDRASAPPKAKSRRLQVKVKPLPTDGPEDEFRSRSQAQSQSQPQSRSEICPRARQLLDIVNSRDPARIQGLVGFGAKKARDLVNYMELAHPEDHGERVESLSQLSAFPGIGGRAIERAYEGLVAMAV